MKDKINVGIIGLGFGKEFIGIYKDHPQVDAVAICTRNLSTLKEIGEQFSIPENLRFSDYEQMLKCDELDAIHVVTPIMEHYEQSLNSLLSGKHTACTVPMATTVEQCENLVKARKEKNKVYMMMETAVYTREFLYVKQLKKEGKLGRIQFVRGAHMQNMGMTGWPEYWLGFPPMHYGTHAIAPLVCITGRKIESVICHGSGTIAPELAKRYGSPFAVETATFRFTDSDVCAEATRSLYDTVRQYVESFYVYGEKSSYEWEQIADEGSVLFDGDENARRLVIPDMPEQLPESIVRYSKKEQIVDPEHVSFIQGAGHGGSHPHLVHEFVSSILENRQSAMDAALSANITSAGISAHTSALQGAERIILPDFQI